MPAGQRPLIRRRLRLELRQERERANKSQTEVAKKMDWSLSKVIRLEAGQVGISTNDLKALLDLYNITDTGRRASLVELARSARQQSAWWTAYRDSISPEYLEYLGLETDAAVLSSYNQAYVPALLHTEDYAREIIRSGSPVSLSEDQLERLFELRMARQEHVLGRDKPPQINMAVEEGVLRRQVGGREVMHDQLTSLAQLEALDNVCLRIVPFTAGAHPGMSGPFQIIDFDKEADPPVLKLDAVPRDVLLRDDPERLEMYRRGYAKILACALSEEESLDLINAIAAEMAEGADDQE